jgi:Helix-turn-helix domain
MTKEQQVRKPARRRERPGYSIPQAAEALNLPEQQVRRAADRGEIKTIPFAGLRRIPPGEIERIRAELLATPT